MNIVVVVIIFITIITANKFQLYRMGLEIRYLYHHRLHVTGNNSL